MLGLIARDTEECVGYQYKPKNLKELKVLLGRSGANISSIDTSLIKSLDNLLSNIPNAVTGNIPIEELAQFNQPLCVRYFPKLRI